MDQHQLLTDACAWFEKEYGGTPAECGVNFIQTWNKPLKFKKIQCVVFAQTEEIGKAFIKQQNAVCLCIKWFFTVPLMLIIGLITVIATKSFTIGIVFTMFFLFLSLYCLYMAKKSYKLEAIHKWQAAVYYTD